MDTAPHPLTELAPGLWIMTFPMKMMGADLRRNVTIIRLRSGQVVIHSTAPFSPEDVSAIREAGEPAWLADTLLRHDTYAKDGREAFPGIPYLAPPGFEKEVDFPVAPLLPAPAEWAGELEVIAVGGVPSLGEHVFFHAATRTLIVADLLFNFGPDEPLWTEMILKVATVGGEHFPGMTKPFKSAVEDADSFAQSMREVLSRDFDRIIVGHGDVIATSGKARLLDAVQAAGFDVA